MAVTVFKDSSYSLAGLISRIEHGEIALPDIQRPFVWSNAKVRDLFDSMYKGFPVGYLLLWSTGAGVGAKQIGTGSKQAAPALLIVDGQQRLTSLYAVISGKTVVRSDYSESRIRVAFRPSDCKFEVTDAAVENDPEYIPDISEVFKGSFLTFVNNFLNRLEQHRAAPIEDSEKDGLVEAIDRLKDIQNYPFQAIELDRTVDEEHVADVFVRINSEGVKLNNADFILTLMSVFWEQGRLELENFARAAKAPPLDGKKSSFNHFIEPGPDQLLRASVGLAFRRGRLRSVYSILRGKDLDTGEFSAKRRDAQFEALQSAQSYSLDLTNWHEFLKCLKQAGFRSSRMVSSEGSLLFVYIFWLIGRRDYNVELRRLRDVIARWWFMSHATGRYTSSPESALESDLNRLRALEMGDAEGFCNLLDRIVRDTFTTDYWEITLPNRLESSSAKSPPLSAYWAALNILDAEMLFSDLKVSTMLDPLITAPRDMERHHLFPKAYLETLGVPDNWKRNAISNMAFVDWSDNLAISDKAPSEYWGQMIEPISKDRLKRQMWWHALPQGWEHMEYDEFCDKRRKLIGEVVRQGFKKMWGEDGGIGDAPISIRDQISDGESNMLEFKQRARWSHGTDKKGKSEQIIAKSVAGFMNCEGGTLLIGVADDGRVVGLDEDYATLSKPNRDGYELFLIQLLRDKISGPSPSLCRIRFHELDGQDICAIEVAASPKPVFSCPFNSKEQTDFWVRQGNRTDQFHGTELTEYIENRWG